MEFLSFENISSYPISHSQLTDQCKKLFKNEECFIYYKYPIFKSRARKNKEPDLLIVHRKYGIHLIEIREYKTKNVKLIENDTWFMNDWENEVEEPFIEAENQLSGIQSLLNENPRSRNKITNFSVWLHLSSISQKEFSIKGFNNYEKVLFQDNSIGNILQKNTSAVHEKALSDTDWESVILILNGSLPPEVQRPIPTNTTKDNPIRVINYLESRLKVLDEQQQKIAYEAPDGPQRLRGLAGTGKTVLLTKRVAKLHAKNPNWKIAYVFFTRSLYDTINFLIKDYFSAMTNDAQINWANIHVLHAWGSINQAGYYSKVCNSVNQTPMNLNAVHTISGRLGPTDSFRIVCDNILNQKINLPEIYDAVIIDEGQSLPTNFYKLVYRTTKSLAGGIHPLKRIYWAYDEAQSLGNMIIPNSEQTFGRDDKNNLLVDVSSSYAGGIQKSHKMTRCYRTPRKILMTAHAINMGLFRFGGAISGVTNKNDWESLGYQIIEGDFRKIGEPIVLTRPEDQSPHPVDTADFPLRKALGDELSFQIYPSEKDEMNFISNQVKHDLQNGFRPSDLMITAIFGDYQDKYFLELQKIMCNDGVKSFIAGVDGEPNKFREEDCVTISNIYRAQGNEAYKVYVARFQYTMLPLLWAGQNELFKRNEAFTALTRAKVWCVISGLDSPVFKELQTAINQFPVFKFPAFRNDSLQRNIDDSEFAQQDLFEDHLENAAATLEEKTIKIRDGEKGYSFASLFYPYLINSKKIVIKDPYIRATHQIKNFVNLCDLLAPSSGLLEILLITKIDDSVDQKTIEEKYNHIQQNLLQYRIKFEYRFDPTLHDRVIESDNGWIIKSGFGLDIYQKSETIYALEELDQRRRKCKQNEILYVRIKK